MPGMSDAPGGGLPAGVTSRFLELEDGSEPHVWTTLGYRRVADGPGTVTIAWEATPAYGFPTSAGHRVHGGLVTTLLDTAMGGATWTVLGPTEVFLTADLRVEFQRACPMGPLTATGTVVRRTSRVVFAAAQLHDPQGRVVAESRATQLVLPADGPAGRYGRDGSEPGEGTLGTGDAARG